MESAREMGISERDLVTDVQEIDEPEVVGRIHEEGDDDAAGKWLTNEMQLFRFGYWFLKTAISHHRRGISIYYLSGWKKYLYKLVLDYR